jgi:hypothetical protein
MTCANEVFMPTAHRLDARQIGRQGQVSIEVIKEFADSAPGVGERSDVFFAKRRFRGEVLGAIGEPSESIPFSHDTVGKLYGCFAARSNLR